MRTDRRQALLGAAALGLAGATGIGVLRERQSLPQARAILGAPGFYRIPASAPANRSVSFATLGQDDGSLGRAEPPGASLGPDIGESGLRALLFRSGAPGHVPVAVFNDYRCPTCPTLSLRLQRLDGPPLSITLHEWPVLGPLSVFAARVALAAGLQGAHRAMHAHLYRQRLRPSADWARHAAESLGLDPERLLSDMGSDRVTTRLAETERLARRFGFRGTPSLIVDTLAFEGLPPRRLLRRMADRSA